MRQIKDMLTKESTEVEVINEKIEKIFQVIEDLRNDIMNKTTPEADHNPITSTNTSINIKDDTPQKFVLQIQQAPIVEHET